MINGLRTAIYPVKDLTAAKAWYTAVFGTPPYFDEPFYVGYAIGGFELGLTPKDEPSKAGSKVYWGVDDIEAEAERIVGLGASTHWPLQDVGDGIKVVELADPFGNVLGLIYNPHFDAKAVR